MSFPSAFRSVSKSAAYQPVAPQKRAHVETVSNPRNGSARESRSLGIRSEQEFAESLMDYILDTAILDECFDAHREATLLSKTGETVDYCEPSTSREKANETLRNPKVKIPSSDEVIIHCPECGKSLAVKIFAQHLEQHSGGGRNSFRTAKKKLEEEQRLKAMRIGCDEDNAEDGVLLSPPSGDDDDWNTTRKKKRPPPRNRRKRGN